MKNERIFTSTQIEKLLTDKFLDFKDIRHTEQAEVTAVHLFINSVKEEINKQEVNKQEVNLA